MHFKIIPVLWTLCTDNVRHEVSVMANDDDKNTGREWIDARANPCCGPCKIYYNKYLAFIITCIQ